MAGINLVLFFFCSWTVAVVGVAVLLNSNEHDAPSWKKTVAISAIICGVIGMLGLHLIF